MEIQRLRHRRKMRLRAYAALVGSYFVFGVIGSLNLFWTAAGNALAINISAGCITGFVVLVIQHRIEA